MKLNGCVSEAECCFDTIVRQFKAHTLKWHAVWKTKAQHFLKKLRVSGTKVS